MMNKTESTTQLFELTDTIYDKVFSGIEKKVYDGNAIKNRIIIANFLLEESQGTVVTRLELARRIYEGSFTRFSRMLDGDPIGNILALAEISRKLFILPLDRRP